jgi:integrase
VRQAKERLAAGLWEDHGLVFASTIGTPMEPRNVNRRFEELRKSASLEWLRRTTCGTRSRRSCSTRARSSTIWLTADTYGHVLPKRAREATGAIDRLLGEEGA